VHTAVYLIVKKTGLRDAAGAECVIVIDVKLTRSAAEAVASIHPGSTVEKLLATKLPPSGPCERPHQHPKEAEA
jgi:hypothetical protein